MKPFTVVCAVLIAVTATAKNDVKSGPEGVGAASAVVMDQQTRRVLWSKAMDARRFPASTTKIMSGLLVAENTNPSEVVSAPQGVEKVGESSLHLHSGEQLTAQDMLYAMMLRSANDACFTMAVKVAGSVPAFAKMMNEKAKSLGCTDTHFVNPHGLHDENHYTTAHDLALIACAALDNPRLAEIVKTQRHKVTRSTDSKDLTMVNRNKLLKEDKDCIGMKTGWTVPAGKCFVGAFDNGGRKIVTVVMASQDWVRDTIALEDWAANNVVDKVVVDTGQSLGSAAVKGGTAPTVGVQAARRDIVPWVDGAPFEAQLAGQLPTVPAPVKAGQRLGTVSMRLSDGSTVPVSVVASVDVPAKPPLTNALNPGTIVVGGALVGGWALVRSRQRSRRRLGARRW